MGILDEWNSQLSAPTTEQKKNKMLEIFSFLFLLQSMPGDCSKGIKAKK